MVVVVRTCVPVVVPILTAIRNQTTKNKLLVHDNPRERVPVVVVVDMDRSRSPPPSSRRVTFLCAREVEELDNDDDLEKRDDDDDDDKDVKPAGRRMLSIGSYKQLLF